MRVPKGYSTVYATLTGRSGEDLGRGLNVAAAHHIEFAIV